MRRAVRQSEFFLGDLDGQYRWYEVEAGEEIALRYLQAVDWAVEELAERPDLGRVRQFAHPELVGLRSCPVARPFHRHLIFYRHDATSVDLVRVMHGACDLPERLRQPPGAGPEESGLW